MFQGDNGTFSVTLATSNEDATLRALSSPERFDAAAAALQPIGAVARARGQRGDHRGAPDGEAAQPHPPLRRRRRPAALGVVAIGDAHTCTNPLYGRGCSLGMVHAELLADAVAEHDTFDEAFHLAFEEATAREIEPWYQASVTQDRAQRAEAHRLLLESRGEAPEPGRRRTRRRCSASSCARSSAKACSRPSAPTPRCSARSSAASTCSSSPDALMQDTEVMAKVLEAYQSRDEREPDPPLGPDRAELLRHRARSRRLGEVPGGGCAVRRCATAGARRRRPTRVSGRRSRRWARSLAAMCSGSVGFERYASAPERPAAHHLALVGLAGEHEDVGVGRQAALAACLEDVVAVDLRHHHVEDHRGRGVASPAGRWPRAARRRSGR